MTRTKFIIFSALAVAAAIAVTVLIFMSSETDEPTTPTPSLPSVILTEQDKNEILSVMDYTIKAVGTYGWPEGVIMEPMNLQHAYDVSLGGYRGLYNFSVKDVENALREITGGQNYRDAINAGLYEAIFSVSTEALADVDIPDIFDIVEDIPTLRAFAPVKSRLVFLTYAATVYDENWEPLYHPIALYTLEFEGILEVEFEHRNSKWIISKFVRTGGLFAIDKNFTIMNGTFTPLGDITPNLYTYQELKANAKFDNFADLLPGYLQATQ